MARYRKLPVEVDAYQWRGFRQMPGPRPQWLLDAFNKRRGVKGSIYCEDGRWFIGTLEGRHVVSDGDYIIRGIQGELYPCKPDIFESTYERVDGGGQG